VPGWPADVPLSVDPDWKSQYAASVRRLVRDGVDSPLAKLFVHAAVIRPSNADSPDRARSATEAFLYRRLETLAETAGRFRLNAELPIPFDGWGRMEVDLLCEPPHIAIELDGRQHLGDAEAYRRDRRKDALLQEKRLSGSPLPLRRRRQISRSSSGCHSASFTTPKRQDLSRGLALFSV
jgi:hypothetical protein